LSDPAGSLFEGLDTAAVSRSLSQLAERAGDLADAYFERLEEIELDSDGGGPGRPPGIQVRREEGFALRLVRGGRSWMASRDGIDAAGFVEALRQVARAYPRASYPEPRLDLAPLPPDGAAELAAFRPALERRIREQHVAFPLRLRIRRHRRWLQVVGTRLVPDAETEAFYSCRADLPGGSHGALYGRLGPEAAGDLAAALVALFRAREAPPPEPGRRAVALGAGAAAVLLHEAVAHALEADTLALSGRPERAVGVRLGAAGLDVLDDPASAPEGVRRRTDDEGLPVLRRWLLRDGTVEQPLADATAARDSAILAPGAARRGSRHLPPAPRSSHLELLAGEHSEPDILAGAEGGLYFPVARAGLLDPLSGTFELFFDHGRRVARGEVAEAVGPCRLRGRVAELLAAVTGIGRETAAAGAGWCAKGGRRLAVWATAAPVLLEGVEIRPEARA
jgi:predicted Zn-dependent protease